MGVVDVEEGQEAEQNRFEHGWVRGGGGTEGEEQGPEIGGELREGERVGAGGVEEDGERFEEEREEGGGGVGGACSATGFEERGGGG